MAKAEQQAVVSNNTTWLPPLKASLPKMRIVKKRRITITMIGIKDNPSDGRLAKFVISIRFVRLKSVYESVFLFSGRKNNKNQANNKAGERRKRLWRDFFPTVNGSFLQKSTFYLYFDLYCCIIMALINICLYYAAISYLFKIFAIIMLHDNSK